MNAKTTVLAIRQLSKDERKALSSVYFRHMMAGILWCVAGAVLTVATLAIGKGAGVIFYGAIIFGVIDFFRGLFGWMRYML
jgi:hypothetical protein